MADESPIEPTSNPKASSDSGGQLGQATTISSPEQGVGLPIDEAQWRNRLSPERFVVLRQKGTEPAFSGALLDLHDPGMFRCAGCGAELFRSDDKFDSGSGWPSFTKAADEDRVTTQVDRSHGMTRTEIMCSACGGHLGHVFDDGPNPTGQRFCVNSLSLEFQPGKDD